MKLHRAGALALASWYLMSPPIMRIPRSGSKLNPAAHLRYWKIRGTYPSLSDCDDAGRAMLGAATGNSANLSDDILDLSPSEMRELIKDLVCVSSDDPGLEM
jgi:hypothetical protein